MIIVYGLLALILTYLLVIGLHELGHAMAARYFAIQIQSISLGFGRAILRVKSKAGYHWLVNWIPLGGYVSLLNTRIQPVAQDKWPLCFDKKPIGIRCIVLLSGGFMNMLVAWICLFSMALMGYQRPLPIIKHVTPNSIAAKAGLQARDQLLSIKRTPTASWQDAATVLITTLGNHNVSLRVKDARGHIKQTQLNLSHWYPRPASSSLWKQIGITPSFQVKQTYPPQPIYQAATWAAHQVFYLIHFFMTAIVQLITGHLPLFLLVGPLSFIDLTIQSFLHHLTTFLYFIASLSLAVGIVNLLPLPGLDGGSILYACIEKIRGRPLSVAWECLLHRLFLILFFIFFAQLVANDFRLLSEI